MHVSCKKLPKSNTHMQYNSGNSCPSLSQHIYTTPGGSLTLIMNNGKEFKKWTVAKHYFWLSTNVWFFITRRWKRSPWSLPNCVWPCIRWKNISISSQKYDSDHPTTRSPDKFKSVTLYTLKHFPSTWNSKWEPGFQIVKYLTPPSAVMESTINRKSRNACIRHTSCKSSRHPKNWRNTIQYLRKEQGFCLQMMSCQICNSRSDGSVMKNCVQLFNQLKLV